MYTQLQRLLCVLALCLGFVSCKSSSQEEPLPEKLYSLSGGDVRISISEEAGGSPLANPDFGKDVFVSGQFSSVWESIKPNREHELVFAAAVPDEQSILLAIANDAKTITVVQKLKVKGEILRLNCVYKIGVLDGGYIPYGIDLSYIACGDFTYEASSRREAVYVPLAYKDGKLSPKLLLGTNDRG